MNVSYGIWASKDTNSLEVMVEVGKQMCRKD